MMIAITTIPIQNKNEPINWSPQETCYIFKGDSVDPTKLPVEGRIINVEYIKEDKKTGITAKQINDFIHSGVYVYRKIIEAALDYRDFAMIKARDITQEQQEELQGLGFEVAEEDNLVTVRWSHGVL